MPSNFLVKNPIINIACNMKSKMYEIAAIVGFVIKKLAIL